MIFLKIKRIFLLSLISILVLNVCGCTTTSYCNKRQPTMAEVYQETQQQTDGNILEKVREKMLRQNMYKQNVHKKRLFQRLPNPEIVFYVYPHFAGSDDVPVPGYITSIPMFKEVHYAIPGEI